MTTLFWHSVIDSCGHYLCFCTAGSARGHHKANLIILGAGMSAIGSQKAGKDSQNKGNINESHGVLCHKHYWLSFTPLKIKISFLILL